MASIIEVNNLSKSYTISHQGLQKYTALRDVVSSKVKSIFSKSTESSNNSRETFWALKDVNFKIEKGDKIGVIGRNGAGKSTLLKILSRITEPTTGVIKIKGRIASLLEVGTGFHPELSGRENIFLNGAILGMSRAEIKKHFDEIVDFADIEKFLDTPVKRYSSGMYVRLAFAVAAHLEPEVLVIDEVLAVGDAEFQKKCLGKMDDVSKQGRTIVFVSHNMSAISSLCNKGLLLKKGQLESYDTIDKIIKLYVNKNDRDNKKDFTLAKTADRWAINYVEVFQNNERVDHVDASNDIYFKIYFSAKERKKISFEILIKDINNTPIIFLPLGLANDLNFVCEKGNYSMSFKAIIPQLSMGEYLLDIFIVETNIQRLGVFENICSFEVTGSNISQTGWNFERNPNLGSLIGDATHCELMNI